MSEPVRPSSLALELRNGDVLVFGDYGRGNTPCLHALTINSRVLATIG
jgi:hypothetical protein